MGQRVADRQALDWLGIPLALVAPGMVAWFANLVATDPETLAPRALSLAFFGGILVATLVVALRLQKLSLGEIGFRNVGIGSLLGAILLTLFFVFVFGPVAYRVLSQFGVGGFGEGLSTLHQLPVWYLVIAIVVVAGGEEWIYRGYAIERLEKITGRAWLAGTISLVFFSLAHLPFWGTGPALTTIASGAVLTVLYIWRRDILMLILAHIATDLIGILSYSGA